MTKDQILFGWRGQEQDSAWHVLWGADGSCHDRRCQIGLSYACGPGAQPQPNKKLDSTWIDAEKEFAMPLISESLKTRRVIFIDGGAGEKALPDVIWEEGLIVRYLSDEMLFKEFQYFKIHDRNWAGLTILQCSWAMLRRWDKTLYCALSSHACSWLNFAIPFFHEWIHAFLIFAKSSKTSHLSTLY